MRIAQNDSYIHANIQLWTIKEILSGNNPIQIIIKFLITLEYWQVAKNK